MYVYFTFLLDHSNILFFILFFVEIVLSRVLQTLAKSSKC